MKKIRRTGRKGRIVLAALALVAGLSACGKSEEGTSAVTSVGTEADTGTTEDKGTTEEAGTTEAEGAGAKYLTYKDMTPEKICASLTTEQKAAQMVQPACYEVSKDQVREKDYGSILSKPVAMDAEAWTEYVNDFQKCAVESEAGIPYIYGQDDVHGVNYALDTVIFPHNIGLGAANDPELMYQVGLITADEAKMCHMLWNFSPCVAQSVDPRSGRTYESYGSDPELIKNLSTAYTSGLVDGGIVACAKHFLADGNVIYGTGEDSDAHRLIDRGNAELSEEEIQNLLSVYRAQIDAGVQTIMISHSSLNGVKMHENAEWIGYLKKEMGFKGFIVSDWNSVQNTSPETYHDQVVTAVNAGIDMLMEVSLYDTTIEEIVKAVNAGEITEERLNDAVTRILKVKKDAGVISDPYGEKLVTEQTTTGSEEYRKVAEQLVEESLVLLKNEGSLLPLKQGSTIYVTGPAADRVDIQCGGWTLDWNGPPTTEVPGATSILQGFQTVAEEHGIKVITDEDDAASADAVVLVVGEQAYAEWNGDTEDLELCGKLGLYGNKDAIEAAKDLGKPVITLIVAGRNVILGEDYASWDSVVMCYLPGSEGQGVARVLCGDADFRGKLPAPWYDSVDKIESGEAWLETGYGLTY